MKKSLTLKEFHIVFQPTPIEIFRAYLKNFFLQRTKKVVSDSPGLVDSAIGLVKSVFNLPDGQVMFFEEFE